jgi:hypothetical protein
MAGKWMKRAFSKNKGKFSGAAKKAGMSTRAYAAKVTRKGSKASTKVKREANLAKVGMRYASKGGRHSHGGSRKR